MFIPTQIYRAPPHSGTVKLGRTVPSLLDQGCDRNFNPLAFNQWHDPQWQPTSNHAFRHQAEGLALGLLDLGLVKGDRLVLLLESDVTFGRVDLACLLAGIVTVPINMGETLDNIGFMVQHSGAKALLISDGSLLLPLLPYLKEATALRYWISVALPPRSSVALGGMYALEALQKRGEEQWSDAARTGLRSHLKPTDLATIIYVAGPTGKCQTLRHPEPVPPVPARAYVCEQPKGVMLTHENLSANALAAFGAIPGLQSGARETVLSFLPLTHIFARVLFYGHLAYGHTIYFSTPLRVAKHLKQVQPTIMATVPRLLEKVHQNILAATGRLTGWQRLLSDWALRLAQQQTLTDALERPFARGLVFRQWRAVFGQRLKYLLCGGAALSPELARWYATIGLPIMQGYGLTQTSAVLSVNRGRWQRPGTVGRLIPGVHVAIATDQEILVKAPYVMSGYYRNPAATQAALEPNGWFHTGDLGTVSTDGYLTITGHKKSLFKLSTGKYVTPEPIEHALRQSPLVAQAVVVGDQRPYCAVLIFPNLRRTQAWVKHQGLERADTELFHNPQIHAYFQHLVDLANRQVPRWSTAKRFRLVNATLTVNNGLLLQPQDLNRPAITQTFAQEIAALYLPNSSLAHPTLSASRTDSMLTLEPS